MSDGPKLAAEVFKAARADGHSSRTIKRAKANLGVESMKAAMDGRWLWVIPGSSLTRDFRPKTEGDQ